MDFIIQIISNITMAATISLLIAASFISIYSTSHIFHLAHASTITLGAYFVHLFSQIIHLNLFIATPLSIICSVILGISCELFIYKPLRAKNAPTFTYMIASIGIYTVLQNCISITFGDDTKTLFTSEVTVGHEFLGAYITTVQIITIVVSALLFVAVWWFNQYTKLGKSIRAVATNPELCNIYGINSNRVILWTFAIGSALGAIAGILSAYDTNMTPTFGFNLLLYGVVAMIIGGIGSMRGLLGGALLVASAQHLAAYYIDTKWMDAVAYFILITFLIWKPYGFSGNRLKKVEI